MSAPRPDAWADRADDIRRYRFEPAAGCRCASCVESRGYLERAEVWQARATQAEARVAALEAAITIAQARAVGLEDAIEKALELLHSDYPHAAADRLRKAVEPPHA